jgi:small subunit ribosomal protein S7
MIKKEQTPAVSVEQAREYLTTAVKFSLREEDAVFAVWKAKDRKMLGWWRFCRAQRKRYRLLRARAERLAARDKRLRFTFDDIMPDPVYRSRLVPLIIARVMKSGKKSLAQKIVYDALYLVGKETGVDPIFVLEKAVRRAIPRASVGYVRGWGVWFRRFYIKALLIRVSRGIKLAIKWLVDSSRGRAGRGLAFKLSREVRAASENRGGAVRTKQGAHRAASRVRRYQRYNRYAGVSPLFRMYWQWRFSKSILPWHAGWEKAEEWKKCKVQSEAMDNINLRSRVSSR